MVDMVTVSRADAGTGIHSAETGDGGCRRDERHFGKTDSICCAGDNSPAARPIAKKKSALYIRRERGRLVSSN
jgi:hypothetical protein